MHYKDVLKMFVVLYILVIYLVNPVNISFLSHPLVLFIMSTVAFIVFLLYDIVLGIVIGVAVIISVIKSKGTPSPTSTSAKANVDATPRSQDAFTAEESKDKGNQIELKPMSAQDLSLAEKALEKYVVDDLLNKASTDGIIAENYDKFENPLGQQYNIQGIEKDIVGFNYAD